MNNKCIILILIFSWIVSSYAHTQSKLVSFDQKGKLIYHRTLSKKIFCRISLIVVIWEAV